MILNETELNALTFEEIKNCNHLVLDIEHAFYNHIAAPLKDAIEIINFISKMQRVNKTYKQLNVAKTIDLQILYEAIETVMNNKKFNEHQIIKFLDVLRINKEFENCFVELVEICNYLPSNVELALYGFNFKDIIETDKNDYETFTDKVFDYQYKALNNEISVIEFITTTRALYKKFPKKEDLKITT